VVIAPATERADSDRTEEILTAVRAHGGRATPAKRILVKVLLTSHGHKSAEDIAVDVRVRAPDVAITTVYRNPEELERIGLVDRTRTDHGPATYHLASAPHGHLVCESCGAMTEVPSDLFADLAGTTWQRYGFRIEPRKFAVLGRCAACHTPGHWRRTAAAMYLAAADAGYPICGHRLRQRQLRGPGGYLCGTRPGRAPGILVTAPCEPCADAGLAYVSWRDAMLLFVLLGVRPSSGYQIQVTRVISGEGALIVRALETIPRPDDVTALALTAPYQAVKIPRVDGTIDVALHSEPR
jgi:Fur family transcriptional regulator, ferric uptake regulator